MPKINIEEFPEDSENDILSGKKNLKFKIKDIEMIKSELLIESPAKFNIKELRYDCFNQIIFAFFAK